jgi:hypothetical protein
LSSSRPNFQRRRSSIFSAGLFHPACVIATWRGPLTLNSHRELRRSMEMFVGRSVRACARGMQMRDNTSTNSSMLMV